MLAANDKVSDRANCLIYTANLAQSEHDETQAALALSKLEHMTCSDDASCILTWRQVAGMEESRGNVRQAVSFLKRILQRDPRDEQALLSLARLASASGVHSEAIDAYKKLLALHPGDARYAAKIDEEKQKAIEGALKR